MIANIRLDKKTKTIKVVNRRYNVRLTHTKGQNIRLAHTGKRGPEGPKGDKGDAATPGQAFHIGLFADPDAWHVQEVITVVHNLGTKFLKVPFFNIYDVAETDAHETSYAELTYAYDEAHLTETSWTPIDDNTIKICITYGTQVIDDGNGGTAHMSISVDAAILFAGQKGVKGDTGTSTMVRTIHGADPTVARPDALYVEWVGSVAPNNATIEDTWIHTQ